MRFLIVEKTRCLTADPVTKTISVAAYTGSTNQLWSIAISSAGNALRSESTDTRIRGYKMYYTSSMFTLSNTNFSSVGFYQFSSFVPLILLTHESFYLAPEQSKYVYPEKMPSNASTSNNWYEWSVVNTDLIVDESIATVESSGRVTGVASGMVILRFRDKITQVIGSCYIYVTEVPQGTYFIENRTYEKFMQVDNDEAPDYSASGAIMEQFSFDGGDYQKWTITALGDGYYKILSAKSGLALSVDPDNPLSKTASIYQLPYTGATTQQWQITLTRNGSYKIKARSSIGYTTYDLVLDVQAQGSSSANGLNMQQREYVDNSSYKDEWFLFPIGNEIVTLGITDSGHDHETIFNWTVNSIAITEGKYTSLNYIVTDSLSKSECITALKNSKVFVSRGHGYYGSSSTYIVLSNDASSWMSSVDIYNFDTGVTLQNLEDVYLAVYVGCYTAYGGTGSSARNLVTASTNAGADYAIGFADSIYCDDANNWTGAFFELLATGKSVLDAVLDMFDGNYAIESCYVDAS